MTRVYLGLGSNLGDRAGNLEFARRELEAGPVTVRAASSVEETEPVGPVAQGDFLNQVLEVDTDLAPLDLLAAVKDIERRAGRTTAEVRWGPRVLDIDILLYGDEVLDLPGLRVPHPELLLRDFVLRELGEVAPGLVDPRTGRPLALPSR